MAYSYKFHGDHVGGLLRPPALLDAQRQAAAGTIGAAELRDAQNEAIAAAVKTQKEAGLDLFTDGEFRRRDFWSCVVDAFDGFTPGETPAVTGRLRQLRRMTEGDAAFLRTVTSGHLKVTLVAPGYVAERCWRDGVTDLAYPSREELGAQLAAWTRAEIEALFAEGVMYVQLDNPGYTGFLNSGAHAGGNGRERAGAFERMLAADTAAVAGVQRPDGASVGIHLCGGDDPSRWLTDGGDAAVAERLLGSLPVDRFLVEYDDWRAGSFAPLRYVPQGKVVVLGMVGPQTQQDEVDELVARIDEAAELIDIDDLAVSPRCGFAAPSMGGPRLTEREQFRKLRIVADAAIIGWGPEG